MTARKRTATPKQLAGLALGPLAIANTPGKRKQIAQAGGLAVFKKLGREHMLQISQLGDPRARAIAGGLSRAKTLGSEGYRKMRAAAWAKNPSGTPAQLKHIKTLGDKNVASGFLESIKTKEGSRRGGIVACHRKWHTARGPKFHKPGTCELCAKELENAPSRAEPAA